MPKVPEKLTEVADDVQKGTPRRETVRTLLSWFNTQRRGYWKVAEIQDALRRSGLSTEPNFEHQHIDAWISFVGPTATRAVDPTTATSGSLVNAELVAPPLATPAVEAPTEGGSSGVQAVVHAQAEPTRNFPDPVPRIGMLAAASRTPVSISRNATVQEAVTLMMLEGFSQLAVTGGARTDRRAISWRSIGRRRALGKTCELVGECTEQVIAVRDDTPLFTALAYITEHDYVFVTDRSDLVSGIVTTADVGEDFRVRTEPFLLLGEIENHLRKLIDNRFTLDELRAACDPSSEREITHVSHLTFGEYVRLLESPKNWEKLDLPLDRAPVIAKLIKVRDIRNDVMHFDPDPQTPEDLKLLRDVAAFMRSF